MNSVRLRMTEEEVMERYLLLALIRGKLRNVSEHGLANLVNDRMCIINNLMDDAMKKEAAIAIAGFTFE